MWNFTLVQNDQIHSFVSIIACDNKRNHKKLPLCVYVFFFLWSQFSIISKHKSTQFDVRESFQTCRQLLFLENVSYHHISSYIIRYIIIRDLVRHWFILLFHLRCARKWRWMLRFRYKVVFEALHGVTKRRVLFETSRLNRFFSEPTLPQRKFKYG